MQGNSNNEVVARLLDQAYMEVIPTKSIMDRLIHIPRHSYVSITCSPVNGLEPTLQVRDKGHLKEVLARLEAARVASVFVPGGDAEKPAGDYDCSLDLLRDMAEIGHSIEDVGIASHPEGHSHVSDQGLVDLLLQKQEFASYLVTQMCFDPKVLTSWLKNIRNQGVNLPAWIGLPGVADMSKLISLSLRIGVGQSVKILMKQKGLLKKMISAKPYQPDDLLAGLMPSLADEQMNIPGFHLFSFNDIERTERWRVNTQKKFNGLDHA
jgi:methylenetetrahydrofolate reductase (NADPH)